jgi:hypothetical protein
LKESTAFIAVLLQPIARKPQQMGHTVRLKAPQFVKPYVKANKNLWPSPFFVKLIFDAVVKTGISATIDSRRAFARETSSVLPTPFAYWFSTSATACEAASLRRVMACHRAILEKDNSF